MRRCCCIEWICKVLFAIFSIMLLRKYSTTEVLMVKRLRAVEGDPVPNMPFLHVAPGMCWVEGDNADHSIDSRHFGMVSVNSFIECVHTRITPLYIYIGTICSGDRMCYMESRSSVALFFSRTRYTRRGMKRSGQARLRSLMAP